MLPSSTVENYLKAIYSAQRALGATSLVPMGQLAAALEVVPGHRHHDGEGPVGVGPGPLRTVRRRSPHAGGDKLAALVLRRHRLIELFLVQVMGMSWAEVHDEAEHLEHAVSERLIGRMDEMLGHPSVDPHGDPIPNADGGVQEPSYHSLLECPVGQPVRVARVADQDAGFLRFIEQSALMPGQAVTVIQRDAAADSVAVQGADSRRIVLGARAASKVLVDDLPP